MKIAIKITPKKIEANSIPELKSKITSHACYCVSTNGIGYSPLGDQSTLIVFNIEKRRKKVEQHKKKSGLTYRTVVLKKAICIAYVYTFNKELLKLAGLKVVQGTRTFEIVKR